MNPGSSYECLERLFTKPLSSAAGAAAAAAPRDTFITRHTRGGEHLLIPLGNTYYGQFMSAHFL